MRPEEVAAALSPALRAKVQEVGEGLTPDERAHLRLLLEEAGAAADDTAGYAVGLYVGDDGNKGRPRPGTPANATGFGNVPPETLGYIGVAAYTFLVGVGLGVFMGGAS
jgi:hypothetical protein